MRKFTRWRISFLILFLSCIKLLAIGHATVADPKVWEASINLTWRRFTLASKLYTRSGSVEPMWCVSIRRTSNSI